MEGISTLRTLSCIVPRADIEGIHTLKKYYCQLHFIQSRFRIKGDSEDGPFAFKWAEIYNGQTFTNPHLDYELASVLYNIGALHMMLGNMQDRTETEGLRVACSHFQYAAWSFQTIKEKYQTDPSTDLSHELMQFLYQICLAQVNYYLALKKIFFCCKGPSIKYVRWGIKV